MISKEEIKRLADLARIEVGESEQEELAQEIDAILDYVKLIQQFHPDEALPKADNDSAPPLNDKRGLGGDMNVWREDENPTESGTYSKDLIAEFPNSENNYLKVKKIL
ncbi:MAG: Asp-tRNA(Asn)/Glu-tRNA(Gln) amidotransferase subunit GatC [Patescibacteria group bacterium]